MKGALLDELLLVTGLAFLLQTNLRAKSCAKLYATDASPSGGGGGVASITQESWLSLYDLADEKEHMCAPIGETKNTCFGTGLGR